MLDDLAAQDSAATLSRRLRHYCAARSPGNRRGRLPLLLQPRTPTCCSKLVTRRYEQTPTVVTTNKPFAEWNEVFPNAACVVTLIDRLIHNAEIVTIEGDSLPPQGSQGARRATGAAPPAQEVMTRARTRHIELPDHWTPKQALAAFELIELIRDEIWRLYRDDIQKAMRKDRQVVNPQARSMPFDPDNPF